ncbi:MAG: helix-turn-helix transcriptional regulator [Desulfamplus sp.]|nr:helix-turn-helix transcriptional regulator [Desulfamplus sp.]
METKPFSEQVKAVRSALNLSQEELAHALGVSFATVNRWENGKTSPSKLAQRQFELFCEEQRGLGKLTDEKED